MLTNPFIALISLNLRVHGAWGGMKRFWATCAQVVDTYSASRCEYVDVSSAGHVLLCVKMCKAKDD